jgi:hypothetical protein
MYRHAVSHRLGLVSGWLVTGGIVKALEEGGHVLVACRCNNPLCTVLVSDLMNVSQRFLCLLQEVVCSLRQVRARKVLRATRAEALPAKVCIIIASQPSILLSYSLGIDVAV